MRSHFSVFLFFFSLSLLVLPFLYPTPRPYPFSFGKCEFRVSIQHACCVDFKIRAMFTSLCGERDDLRRYGLVFLFAVRHWRRSGFNRALRGNASLTGLYPGVTGYCNHISMLRHLLIRLVRPAANSVKAVITKTCCGSTATMLLSPEII